MTMYRMRQREFILALAGAIFALRRSLLDLIDRHRETILALHTHTQLAQPSTVAHYFLGVVEQLERDWPRLKAAYERTNRNPLGACAITGTGFPIDRQLTSDLLGFCGPTGNTYGSIATVDYLLESTSAAAVAGTGLGRFLQDMLLWSTAEFGYLRLGDGFVQGSSIMPQKRNPVALEHARAIASKGLGQAQAIVLAVHNTPYGDIVDTEDDLQPLVFSMFRDSTRAMNLAAAAMATAEFDAARARSARRRRLDDADGAGRYAGAGARPRVQDRARDLRAPGARTAGRSEAPAVGTARERLDRAARQAAHVFRKAARRDSEPAAFRRDSPHARRPRPGGNRARGQGLAPAARGR